jgi:HK97 family phage major capsid protein
MKKFHLSAVFMLAVIFLVALMPTAIGFNVLGVGASVGVLIVAALLAEKAPDGYVSPRMSPMRGEAGAPEIKEAVLAALKERDTELNKFIAKSDQDIKDHGKVLEETKQAIQALTEKGVELTERLLATEQKSAESDKGRNQKELSPGELFAKSDQLKDFVSRGGKGASQTLDLKSITSGSTSGGAGIWSDRLAGVIEDPLRPLTVRDLLAQGSTSSNLIEWIRENVFTNNAAPVTEGGTKPQSNITYERVDVPVRTIAHWIPATKQVLADFPQLQTLINGRLRYGLMLEEEDQILLGDGTGENIHGLVPQATAYQTARNKTGDTRIDQIRHAILQVRQAFYPSTGIVMNPADWEVIELQKDGEDRYLFANPNALNIRTLWGLPVVESDAMPAGEFLVGSYRMAATLFDREQATIAVADQHADFFIKNMLAILAEERLALAVSRPKAFVHGDFI